MKDFSELSRIDWNFSDETGTEPDDQVYATISLSVLITIHSLFSLEIILLIT